MAQVINTNVAALFASAALNRSAEGLQTAQQRLSSGLRINTS
ncbi:MAG: flagellin, partial [Gammaproteobacteria bacterium]|nr:flagellin [Gammaproteobacteria bacterium]MBU1416523.1 flagellin [Gammaproteobacteria bacterium]